MRAAETFRALCVPARSRSTRRPAQHLPLRQLLPHMHCTGLQNAPQRLTRMRNCRISARPAGRAFSVPPPLPSARPNRAGGGDAAHAPAFWKKRPRRSGATEPHGAREECAAHTSGFAPPRPRPRPAPRRTCCRRGRRLRLLSSSPPDRPRPAAARGARPRTPSRGHTPPCHVTCRRATAAAGPN